MHRRTVASTRLDPDEERALRSAARRLGLPYTVFLRRSALAIAGLVTPEPGEADPAVVDGVARALIARLGVTPDADGDPGGRHA